MNQKFAKHLRKMARELANEKSPKVAYVEDEYRRKYSQVLEEQRDANGDIEKDSEGNVIMVPKTKMIATGTIKVKEDSVRGIYRSLKKSYKTTTAQYK